MMDRHFLLMLSLLIGSSMAHGATAAPAAFGRLDRVEFQPASGETLKIPFTLSTAGSVRIEVVTGDGDVVRTLSSQRRTEAGQHSLDWDGHDDAGRVVPDEAYHLVLRCRCGDAGDVVVDSRSSTGGEQLAAVKPALSPDGTIAFDIPVPARVLIRVGMKGGAMMRSLESWQPKAPGRARVEWDGRDASGVELLLGKPGLTVLVTGFTLPAQTIIVSGNRKIDYAAYRQQRKWPRPDPKLAKLLKERDGKRLARQSQLPVSMLRDPATTLAVTEKLPKSKDGAYRVDGPVTFRVDVAADDRWVLDQSLYEVAFFLDGEFVSEEETGYTPLSWRWDPAGLSPGAHTMTVNVSGFWGHVGVASVPLWVEGETRTGTQTQSTQPLAKGK